MNPAPLQRWLPGPLRRHVLHFEAEIERALWNWAAELPADCRVLDAGAGQGQYAGYFSQHRYTGVDLAVGDRHWDYSRLDVIGDLLSLPFADDSFDACLNIVTLEHVREPALVVAEMARVLRPGGRLLLVVPHEWEEHQQPHDYFRYTRYGVTYLLQKAEFREISVEPIGGFFRLLARRLLNGVQFMPLVFALPYACLAGPAALLLPLFDRWDTRRNFTLGFVAVARKDSQPPAL